MRQAVGVQGYQPKVAISIGNPERPKYARMWAKEEYRKDAPGEALVPVFVQRAMPRWGASVIDFGCGTGRPGMALLQAGMRVTMLDFAGNCLDDAVRAALCDDLRFTKHDLEDPIPLAAEFGFCADVMEHVPTDKVDVVFANILRAAKNCFFAIATVDDRLGGLIGEQLHLTVKPGAWWRERLEALGFRAEWSESGPTYACFYGSAWDDVAELIQGGSLNVTEDKVADNIRINAACGWMPVVAHPEQDTEVMILGGGPTLTQFEDDIRRMRSEGVKLVTLNGTYNWCLERGIIPSATVMVDARPFNKRFVTPVVEDVKYLLSSQCDPSIFDGLPKDRTFIWHDGSDRTRKILGDLGISAYWHVPGGSTVLLRAIPLLRMLGFHRFHLFGCDSCLMAPAGNGKGLSFHHHAFPQPENDHQIIIPVMVNSGKIFYCNPWMALQSREFVELVKAMAEHIDMIVYGGGLLAHIIQTGAELSPEEEE